MSGNGPFGFDPEEVDRVLREAGQGLREAFGRFAAPARSARPEPETSGDAGDGVWAVLVVGDDGGARVDEVHPTELEALRANRSNVDPRRRVRFLPYGVAVGALNSEPSRPRAENPRPDGDAG